MSASLARLRKRAAELEQKKQFDRALEVYVQILDEGGKDLDDEDVPLFNRVGDMLMRKGSVTEALGYYERAVDMYAERGYLNNAIALCSKILRQSPGRAAVYYKLARISARKGFKSDARKNFLEYADRMQKLGMADEAFRALKEFASLYPDQDDVRLVLAELLSKENRKGEALEQLQSLYEKLQAEGRAAEARATIDRMRAIDPTVTPREGAPTLTPAASDLVFLDLTDAESRPTLRQGGTAQPASARAPMPTPVPALTGLSITFLPEETDAPHPEGFESTAVEPEAVEAPPVARSETPAAAEVRAEPASDSHTPLADVARVIPFEMVPDTPAPLERVEHVLEDLMHASDSGEEEGGLRSVTPLSGSEFADLPLGEEAPREQSAREHDLSLPGDLPQTPVEFETVVPPMLESHAAAEDARAAAEDAAELEADLAAREAAQVALPPEWQRFTPVVPPIDRSAVPEAELEFGADPAAALEEALHPESQEEFPDDFLTRPPSFGGSSGTVEEHAFPPLAGLDEGAVSDEVAAVEADPEPAMDAPPPKATLSIGSAESHLRGRLELDPDNHDLRRQLGEALLDKGDRDGGLHELELAVAGFETRGEVERAQEVVDEILAVFPGSVVHHQKRVEYAVRSRDRGRLTHSYLELADALFRTGAADKAVAVYSRVLELDKDNERAEFALATLAPEELVRRRGVPARPERWSDELVAIQGGMDGPTTFAAPRDSAPDESTPSMTPPERPPHESPTPQPRVRVATLELPVPDWGEGVPARTTRPAPHSAPVSDATPPDSGVQQEPPAAGEFARYADYAPANTPGEPASSVEPGRFTEYTPAEAPDQPASSEKLAQYAEYTPAETPDEPASSEKLVRYTEYTPAETPDEPASSEKLARYTEYTPAETPDEPDASVVPAPNTEGARAASPDEPTPFVDLAEELKDAVEHEDARELTSPPAPDATGVRLTPMPSPEPQPRLLTPVQETRYHTPESTPAWSDTPLSVPAGREVTPLPAPTQRDPTPVSSPAPREPTPRSVPRPRSPTPQPVPAIRADEGSDSDFIDLGEWLRNNEPVRSTRMQVEDPRPSGDEQADFEEMLRRFKRGVAENVEAEDYDAHYDLGVAYKEMGLIDEAIAQFQKALRGTITRVKSYEALGQCFVEKEQFPIAAALLQRATEVPGSDDQQLVGVLYLLGFANEHMGRPADALPYYLRVFAVDIEFRDIAERVAALGNTAT